MAWWVVVSDIHVTAVAPLVELCRRTPADGLICLGDVERPESLEALLNAGLPLLYTPGNHDYDLIRADVLPEWGEGRHAEVREFVRAACARDRDGTAGLEVPLEIGHETCLLAHAWPGDLDNPWREPRHRTLYQLWRIVNDRRDLILLFDYMEGHGYWLFLRGHQHQPGVRWRTRSGPESTAIGDCSPDGAVALGRARLYVITVGAYCLGRYALLEEDGEDVRIRFGQLWESGCGQ